MKIVIPRGGAGAGKSTWWHREYANALVASTDLFFTDTLGNYKFIPEKIGEAHDWCLRGFVTLCMATENAVLVVDNTNISLAEFAPYAAIASAYGHEVEIVTFVYDPVAAYKRNIHGVTLKVCMEMYTRLQANTALIPPWWNHMYALWDETWPFANVDTK